MKTTLCFAAFALALVGCTPVPGDEPDAGDDTDAGLCAAEDARGVGSCEMVLGTVWDGSDCVSIGGCECEGADCDQIERDLLTCRIAYAGCLGMQTCGGAISLDCPTDHYCDHPAAQVDQTLSGCGLPDALGLCKPRDESCTTDLQDTPNCGCDGVFYPSYCDANTAGVEVDYASPNLTSCP